VCQDALCDTHVCQLLEDIEERQDGLHTVDRVLIREGLFDIFQLALYDRHVRSNELCIDVTLVSNFLYFLLDGRLEVLIRRFVANVRDELLKDDIESGFNTGLHLKYINTRAIFIHRSGRATIKRKYIYVILRR
jgi:hypothetical protein